MSAVAKILTPGSTPGADVRRGATGLAPTVIAGASRRFPEVPVPARRTTLVYLLAASHSGSTLTAQLLASHPEIGTIGELKASARGNPEDYLCSCGVQISLCTFWGRLRVNLAGRGLI